MQSGDQSGPEDQRTDKCVFINFQIAIGSLKLETGSIKVNICTKYEQDLLIIVERRVNNKGGTDGQMDSETAYDMIISSDPNGQRLKMLDGFREPLIALIAKSFSSGNKTEIKCQIHDLNEKGK